MRPDATTAGALVVLLERWLRAIAREELGAATGKLLEYRSIRGPLPSDASRRVLVETAREAVKRGEAGFTKVGREYVVDAAAWSRVRMPSTKPVLRLVEQVKSDEERADEFILASGKRFTRTR